MCRPHLPKHHEDAASSPHTNGVTSWLMAVNGCRRGSLRRFSAPPLSIELVQSLALPWYCLAPHLWLAAGVNSTLQHTRNGVHWNGLSLHYLEWRPLIGLHYQIVHSRCPKCSPVIGLHYQIYPYPKKLEGGGGSDLMGRGPPGVIKLFRAQREKNTKRRRPKATPSCASGEHDFLALLLFEIVLDFKTDFCIARPSTSEVVI